MRLNELLGIEFPFIQGGMANIATAEFAAAVSNAGALGLIGAGGMSPEVFQDSIRRCRTLTEKPFGVNIMLMHPQVEQLAAIAAQENIDLLADEGIVLPLGSALGSGIFSGKGPRVRFEILPVGTVKTTFVTEFESAGINQTRHKISLEATASVRIVLPSGARTVSVQASALMAESILIGEVPQSYIQVPETGDALNFLA